jgi:tetratricopeptide (TPR) repeat protein
MTACGPSHISVGDTYFHLGVAHQHLGESASALHWFKKALTIREEILGDNNAAVGRTYYNMAKAYEASNNRKDALACYERVLVAFVQDDTADLDDLLVVRKEVQALKALLAAEAEGRVLDRIRGKLAAKKNRRRRCTLM